MFLLTGLVYLFVPRLCTVNCATQKIHTQKVERDETRSGAQDKALRLIRKRLFFNLSVCYIHLRYCHAICWKERPISCCLSRFNTSIPCINLARLWESNYGGGDGDNAESTSLTRSGNVLYRHRPGQFRVPCKHTRFFTYFVNITKDCNSQLIFPRFFPVSDPISRYHQRRHLPHYTALSPDV